MFHFDVHGHIVFLGGFNIVSTILLYWEDDVARTTMVCLPVDRVLAAAARVLWPIGRCTVTAHLCVLVDGHELTTRAVVARPGVCRAEAAHADVLVDGCGLTAHGGAIGARVDDAVAAHVSHEVEGLRAATRGVRRTDVQGTVTADEDLGVEVTAHPQGCNKE